MPYEHGGKYERHVLEFVGVIFAIGIGAYFVGTLIGALPAGIANNILTAILTGANTAVQNNVGTVFNVVTFVVIVILLGVAYGAYRLFRGKI